MPNMRFCEAVLTYQQQQGGSFHVSLDRRSREPRIITTGITGNVAPAGS